VHTAEERETGLLLLALLDRPTWEGYEDAHGLCVRHVVALPKTRGAAALRRVLRTRLSVLTWELEEAGRKMNWSVRYEQNGEETTAWCRAPGYLDGATLLHWPPKTAQLLDQAGASGAFGRK
jgi:hypothetical protein